ncbi:hypothetical protein [Actinoplanes sp. NPDC051411]|uniref:hypothetical protein n=1 Tax=Actinoplanes sp. NPDC051411 TaxID=3155522 RepID=UPI00342426B6
MKAQLDELAAQAERRGRKWQDVRLDLERNPDNYLADAYHRAEEDRRNAAALVQEKKRKLELVLADLQLIAPENLTIAAEDTADLLYEGKPTKAQLATFIKAARHDLGSD